MEEVFSIYRQFEEVLKCKWTLAILSVIAQGITRPGAIQRTVKGLTKKVLYQRLHKLERFGILTRNPVSQRPLEVHYSLTPYGHQFLQILQAIDTLQSTRFPVHPHPESFGKE